MQIRNIGIVSPGDMGQAVAMRLKESGFVMYGALAGRSDRTRNLAREAGITDCGTMVELVGQCDLLLSVLDPAAALDNARAAADAMKKAARKPVFVDCNAVAPKSMEEITAIIGEASADCIDVGLIGSPPRGKTCTRIYASGPQARLLEQIKHPNLAVRVISERIGDASAVKMCYGAITKGAVALGLELLITARRMGVYRNSGKRIQGKHSGSVRLDARARAEHAAEGIPLGARNERDCPHLRRRRPHAQNVPGCWRNVRVRRENPARAGIAGRSPSAGAQRRRSRTAACPVAVRS